MFLTLENHLYNKLTQTKQAKHIIKITDICKMAILFSVLSFELYSAHLKLCNRDNRTLKNIQSNFLMKQLFDKTTFNVLLS